MSWDYAELSKAASNHGGPEKYTKYLVKTGEKSVLPWFGVVFVGGIAMAISIQRIIKHYRQKKIDSTVEDESSCDALVYDSATTVVKDDSTQESIMPIDDQEPVSS